MRFARRGVEGRWRGLNARAQQLQANVFAQEERARAIDRDALSKGVRFVVVQTLSQNWLQVQSRFVGLSLARQGHVQQARRGLPELL